MSSNPVLITGAGGGATHYTANLLSSMGYDARHEEDGEDVCVSWYEAPHYRRYPTTILQMRNPRKVVGAFERKSKGDDISYATKHLKAYLGHNPFQYDGKDAIRYTYLWYEMGLSYCDWAFKIEDIAMHLDRICDEIGHTPENPDVDLPDNTEYGEYDSWADLRHFHYGRLLYNIAEGFGYV